MKIKEIINKIKCHIEWKRNKSRNTVLNIERIKIKASQFIELRDKFIKAWLKQQSFDIGFALISNRTKEKVIEEEKIRQFYSAVFREIFILKDIED